MTFESLSGLYHLSSSPISKYKLLQLVSNVYKHQVSIIPDHKIVIDRSLDSTLFKTETGYNCPPWTKLVSDMHEFHKTHESF